MRQRRDDVRRRDDDRRREDDDGRREDDDEDVRCCANNIRCRDDDDDDVVVVDYDDDDDAEDASLSLSLVQSLGVALFDTAEPLLVVDEFVIVETIACGFCGAGGCAEAPCSPGDVVQVPGGGGGGNDEGQYFYSLIAVSWHYRKASSSVLHA